VKLWIITFTVMPLIHIINLALRDHLVTSGR
jgi:hypothetical protein